MLTFIRIRKLRRKRDRNTSPDLIFFLISFIFVFVLSFLIVPISISFLYLSFEFCYAVHVSQHCSWKQCSYIRYRVSIFLICFYFSYFLFWAVVARKINRIWKYYLSCFLCTRINEMVVYLSLLSLYIYIYLFIMFIIYIYIYI